MIYVEVSEKSERIKESKSVLCVYLVEGVEEEVVGCQRTFQDCTKNGAPGEGDDERKPVKVEHKVRPICALKIKRMIQILFLESGISRQINRIISNRMNITDDEEREKMFEKSREEMNT